MRSFRTYPELLSTRWDEQVKKNNEECLLDIENRDKDLITKVENFRNQMMTVDERASLSLEDLLFQIKNNIFLRAAFRKDPTKQSIHEKAQIEWIKAHKYSDLEKLPSNTGGLCFSNKKIHNITTGKRPAGATKSFDTVSPSRNIYGILKHTGVDGGAQDNQRADVENFINQGVDYLTGTPDAKETFEIYLDGQYYNEKRRSCLNDLIPAALKDRILITSCTSIIPSSNPV
jgi:hypothetical protein